MRVCNLVWVAVVGSFVGGELAAAAAGSMMIGEACIEVERYSVPC